MLCLQVPSTLFCRQTGKDGEQLVYSLAGQRYWGAWGTLWARKDQSITALTTWRNKEWEQEVTYVATSKVEQSAFIHTNTGAVLRATLGRLFRPRPEHTLVATLRRLLRPRPEHMLVCPSTTIPFCADAIKWTWITLCTFPPWRCAQTRDLNCKTNMTTAMCCSHHHQHNNNVMTILIPKLITKQQQQYQ